MSSNSGENKGLKCKMATKMAFFCKLRFVLSNVAYLIDFYHLRTKICIIIMFKEQRPVKTRLKLKNSKYLPKPEMIQNLKTNSFTWLHATIPIYIYTHAHFPDFQSTIVKKNVAALPPKKIPKYLLITL